MLNQQNGSHAFEHHYYLFQADGKHLGPVTADVLARDAVAGKLPQDAHVGVAGGNTWQPMTSVPEIQEALRRHSSGPPPPTDTSPDATLIDDKIKLPKPAALPQTPPPPVPPPVPQRASVAPPLPARAQMPSTPMAPQAPQAAQAPQPPQPAQPNTSPSGPASASPLAPAAMSTPVHQTNIVATPPQAVVAPVAPPAAAAPAQAAAAPSPALQPTAFAVAPAAEARPADTRPAEAKDTKAGDAKAPLLDPRMKFLPLVIFGACAAVGFLMTIITLIVR
jgi:hypothetical protein